MPKSVKFILPLMLILAVCSVTHHFLTDESDEYTLIPRKVIFGNPERAKPTLSPDGKQLAFLAPDSNDVLNIYVAPTHERSQAQVVTNDSKRGIRKYLWQYGCDCLLYLQDVEGDENWHLFQTNLETGITRDLTPFSGTRTDVIAYSPKHPNEILVQLNLKDRRFFDVYRIDLTSGGVIPDTHNPGDVHGWIANNHLQVRACEAFREDGGIEIRVRSDASAPWRQFMSWGLDEGLGGAIAFTPSDQALYVLSNVDHDTIRLLSVDLQSGSQRVVAEDPEYDLESLLTHPTRHHAQAVGVERERFGWIFLDGSIKNDFAFLQDHLGPVFNVGSRTTDDTKWIVAARHDDSPSDYYLYDREKQELEWLFNSMPAVKHYPLSKMQPIVFEARDGLSIHGYLTLPPKGQKKSKPLPTVLMVHGGPWVRDTWGFDPKAQWLANRGYAVLQVNYRGSTGYGKKFINAGNREWGAKMHDDLLDAKEWLVEQKISDPEKIAIYGGSYGGYATLVGLAFTPQEFCCGVDIVGPSNLVTLLESIPPYWESGKALFSSRVGDLETEREFLEERSPLFKASAIEKPLLIAQGANDPRVKQRESDQIVEAMRRNEQQVQYLVFPDEGHGFARPQNRIRFYAATEQFLAEHLGGQAVPPTPHEEWEDVLQ